MCHADREAGRQFDTISFPQERKWCRKISSYIMTEVTIANLTTEKTNLPLFEGV
jgi:hypothetical protein